MKPIAIIGCVVGLLAGCGAPEEPFSNIYIKGGSAENADGYVAKVTVGITFPGWEEKGQTFCTGTFVSPSVVLTAAHCVTQDGKYPILQEGGLLVVSGTSRANWTKYTVKSVGWHKDVDLTSAVNGDSKAPNDLAVLYVPEVHHMYAQINYGPSELNSRVVLAGFGATVGTQGPSESGTLRTVVQEITGVDAKKQRIDTGIRTEDNPQGACVGDSGGPLFWNIGPKLYQAGVLSIGTSNPYSGSCRGWNSYTDLAYYGAWLAQAIKDVEQIAKDGKEWAKLPL